MIPNSNISGHNPVLHGGIFSIPNMGNDTIDFSSNVSPLGPPPRVRKAIQYNLDVLQTYPDSESKNLRKALQDYTGISSSRIVVGNGATEIIYNFCRAFLSCKMPVLIPVPTFGEYEAAAKLAGSRPSFFKTMNLTDDIVPFLSKLPRNGCVFLCNPNNPTGALVSSKVVSRIVREAKKKNTLVFLDECFIELASCGKSAINIARRHENLFILRSLTKSFALAGIRIGYGIGSKNVASVLNRIKIPWNVSGFAQKAAEIALSDLNHLKKARNLVMREAAFLYREIGKLDGFECYEPSANFMLIKTESDSTLLQKKLLKRNILIRDCKSFRELGNGFVRVAVRGRKENKKLVEALATS